MLNVTVGPAVPPSTSPTAGPILNTIERGQTIQVNVDGFSAFNPFFDALIKVRDELQATPFVTANLSTAIKALDDAVNSSNPTLTPSLSTIRTTNGDRVRQVNMALDRMEKSGNALKNLLSHKEDANLADTISRLKHQETIYQAVLSVGQRAITPSLFDFLK